jgi:hypothetical protein
VENRDKMATELRQQAAAARAIDAYSR